MILGGFTPEGVKMRQIIACYILSCACTSTRTGFFVFLKQVCNRWSQKSCYLNLVLGQQSPTSGFSRFSHCFSTLPVAFSSKPNNLPFSCAIQSSAMLLLFCSAPLRIACETYLCIFCLFVYGTWVIPWVFCLWSCGAVALSQNLLPPSFFHPLLLLSLK